MAASGKDEGARRVAINLHDAGREILEIYILCLHNLSDGKLPLTESLDGKLRIFTTTAKSHINPTIIT